MFANMCTINNGTHHHQTNKTQGNISKKTAIAATKCHTPSENINDLQCKTMKHLIWMRFRYNWYIVPMRNCHFISLSLYLCLSLRVLVFYHYLILFVFLIFICISVSLLFTENKCKHEIHLFTFGPHDHCSHHLEGFQTFE